MARPGRKSAAQTPAPPSERIKGSSKNPKGTASSKKSASGIRFSAKTLKSLSQKRDEHNSKYKRKASLPQLKAVYRRGLGAFSSSHRPTITGGAPNSRNAWAMARVNKFLMKLAGKKVKAAYVQDDDLMEDGGVTKETTTEFMNWFAGWVKPLRGKMNIGMSIPNEYSQIKGVDDFVFLDVFEKIGQDIDAKPHLKEILSKADELGVSLVLEPIPRHHEFLDDAAKRKKIDRQYLIGYYSKFGFSLMDNGLMHRMPGSLMADRGGMNKLIVCRGCGWRWNTADSDESDKYVCHQCGFDNRTYYDADPIGTYANHGQVLDLINQGVVELKMFNTTPEHAKEYGLDSKRPLYLQKIYISKQNTLKGIGSKVIEYIIDYAKKNEHDLIFGHITQKAEPNIDVIKSMLREAGFNTIDGNDDFYKTIDTKYAHGGLIAPNGKPSNLTPEQYRLVRTPAFKAWFGDWENDPANASKVVDENGEPMVVWHTSRNDFNTFKTKNVKTSTIQGHSIGAYFSNLEKESKRYGDKTRAFFLNIKKPLDFTDIKEDSGKNGVSRFVERLPISDSLKNSIVYNSYHPIAYMILENADKKEKIISKIKKKNDGIVFYENHPSITFVAFEPNQIKLADGSNVTFDVNNPDIRYDDGGQVQLLAPNGKPSNLTPEQWHLVRTPEFKAWFGDWENDPENASKVVDNNGEPLVLHRGNLVSQEELGYTFNLGQNFLKKKNANEFGFFFSNEIDTSKKYMLVDHFDEIRGGSITSVFIQSNKILDLLDFNLKIGQDNFVQGLIEKGVVFTDEYSYLEKKILDFSPDNYEYWGYNVYDYFDVFPQLRNLFIKNGFNSVIFYEMSRRHSKYKVYVAFNSNQIKLADGSNVTFVPNNPDIRYNDGGQVKLLAPNGKPSNLTPEQYRLVRTPAFKAWFGDWETQHRSKLIAQEDGRLIYEGSDIGILETHVVEDGVVEIDRLYIDDKYQKKGIGRACIKYVFDNYGCDKIIAYPHPKSDPFWLKSGVSKVRMDGYFEIPRSAYDCSKIVDDNGEPKVVYHGSRSQFTTFDLSKGGESNTLARVGFWFSPNEGFGLNFTAGTWWGDIKGDYGIEYAVFLSIKNPKVFEAGDPKELFSDSYERFKTDIYAVAGMSARDANIGGLGMALNNPRQTINDYRSMLKKDGYDGILIKQTRFDKRTAGDLNDQIVALYPEQIKLADGSNVNFDPNNPDIRYAKGGRVALPAPNGKPSKLTPEQYRLVRTPAFKAWFGDWENDPANASKVVDENGEPLTVWHFSKRLVSPTEKFYVFNVNKQLGAHFGSVEQTKSISYTPVESDMASLTDYEKERVSQGYYAKTKHISNFRYYQAFLNIRNPIRMKDTPYWENQDLLYALSEKYDIYEDEDWQNGERYAKYFSKKYGVDGVVYLNRYEHELANITNEDEELSDVEMRQIYPQLEDSWIAFYPEQIKLADGSNTTFDLNNPDIRFDEGGKIEKMAETLELTQNSAQYAAGGSTDDCGCGDKAEFGMETNAGQSVHKNDKVLAEVNAILDKYGYEAIKKGEYPIGKVAKGMTIEDIARRHRFPIQDMKKSLELGIRTEKEHTNDQLIAEKIALDHLYEDAEYYQKLQKIEKLYKGSEIDYDFNPMDYYVERDDKRTSVSLYLRDEKMEANNVLFSNEMKLSKAIICREKINHAIEQENKAINSLEKNFWQAVKNIWENCMVMLTNHYYHAITNVENSYSLQDVYTYANGGLAYGNSHSKGGIPLYNKGSKSWIEIEGGEGVVKKESMHMNKALEFEGKKMSACEIVSQINQMTGGVKFKCADVKKIMDNDGNYD